MANRFLSNIRINDAYTFPASDGSNGQFIKTDGSGNLSFADPSASSSASVIYRDNFTGDGSTVVFDLQNSLTTEDQSFIYIDGVYQEKDTYSLSSTQITFTTAPISGHSIEVISIAGINTGPTVIYQDNFTGNGSSTDFTLAQVIDNEVKTFVFLNGVYQFKGTYTVDSTTLSFDTAPANGVDIEVISIASAVQTDSLEAGAVIIPVKNTHTASIAKGTPVYITGNVGASERLQIAPADASNSAKMPAAGLLLTTLAVNAEGYVITGGYLRNITTDTIDGTSTSSNDTVYVKAGGGLTMTKPTGSNLIQNVAKVARSASANAGSLLVSSILRTNDVPNLTTGKIWVGDSNTVESTVVHLDESNNRLGINNNSPNYSLDVTGDANISSNVIIGGNLTVDGTQTILNTQTVEVEDNILQLNTTQGSPDTATATTSGISVYRGDGITQASFIFDDADDTWDLSNNLVVDGNVGIGLDPLYKLDVRGDRIRLNPNSNGFVTSEIQNTTGSFYFGIDNSTGTGFGGANSARCIFSLGDYPMAFYTNSTERMRINSSGNVGIGTDSPYSNGLTIQGNSDDYSLTIAQSNASNAGYGFKSDTSGHFSLARYASGSFGSPALFVQLNTNNIGIGTDSPNAKLDILGASSDQLRLRTAESEEYKIGRNSSTGLLEFYGTQSGYTGYVFGGVNGERMRIDSSGDVLMGNTVVNPASGFASQRGFGYDNSTGNLQAASTSGTAMTIGRNEASDGTIIELRKESNVVGTLGSNTTSGQMLLDISGSSSNGNIRFVTNGAEVMRITSSYNVGIGTASPNSNLQVVGSAQDQIRFGTNTSVYTDLWMGTGYTVFDSIGGNSGAFDFRDDGSSRMFIDSSGNVGIGTTSPFSTAKLQIRTAVNVNLAFQTGTTETSGFKINAFNDAANTNIPLELNGSVVLLKTGETERMRIDSSGRVGINVTPSYSNVPLHTKKLGGGDAYNIFEGDSAWVFGEVDYTGTKVCQVAGRYGHHSGINVNTAGNVGIGITNTQNAKLEVNDSIRIDDGSAGAGSDTFSSAPSLYLGSTQGGATFQFNASSGLDLWQYSTGGSWNQTVRFTRNGKVGIGATSPDAPLTVYGATGLGIGASGIRVHRPGVFGQYGYLDYGQGSSTTYIGSSYTGGSASNYGEIIFRQHSNGGSPRETLRVGDNNFFKVSNNGTYFSSTGNYHEMNQTTGGNWSTIIHNDTATPYGLYIKYSNASPNNATSEFLYCADSSVQRLYIQSNGAVYGQGTYGTISDQKLKENIVDATPKLDDINKLRVRNFNFKHTPEEKHIGFIAQEFEEVFPSMVETKQDKDDDNNLIEDSYTKTIKSSVLIPMLVKSIQELKAEIETLKLQING